MNSEWNVYKRILYSKSVFNLLICVLTRCYIIPVDINIDLSWFRWIPFEFYDKGHALCFPVVACINACSLSSCHRIWMIVIRILPTNCYNCLKVRSRLFITGKGPWLMYTSVCNVFITCGGLWLSYCLTQLNWFWMEKFRKKWIWNMLITC